MKKLLLVSFLCFVPNIAYALTWGKSPFLGDNQKSYNDNYDDQRGWNSLNNSNQSYKSNMDRNYQYNLSNPSDRINYSSDLNAQMRDKMDIDPLKEFVQGLGQYGGGILPQD